MIAFSSYRSWNGIRRTGCTSFDMVLYDARAPNRLTCPGKNLVSSDAIWQNVFDGRRCNWRAAVYAVHADGSLLWDVFTVEGVWVE